ncbi:MAG: hypothetical protein HKN76_05065 [Saprospiraceae bacterium]|nr:hypothetical protein [Saprospiraceae bacterium]
MTLAQFPLQIVVFPNEVIPLHIFEPRYRQLISDCQTEEIAFGITPVIDGQRKDIGTKMHLASVTKKYADGRIDIKAQASSTYLVANFMDVIPEKLYSAAEVSPRTVIDNRDTAASQNINRLMQELYVIMRIPRKRTPTDFALHEVVHKIGFTLEEEYTVLSSEDFLSQQKAVIKQLEKILPRVREMEEIRKRIELNGDPRYIIPPK